MKHKKENKKNNIIIFFLVIITIFGLIITSLVYLHLNNQKYNVISTINYNASLCSNTGYFEDNDNFDAGLKIHLIDKIKRETINGTGTLETKIGASGIGNNYFSCYEGIGFQNASISVYAKNYTPISFNIKLVKNKLITVEIPLTKSCSGGPSYFDNLKTLGKYNNESENYIYEIIEKKLGLKTKEYTLDCIEANKDRGGYIKIKGKHIDNSLFEAYYHWGWCSSGGSDCGWSLCFKTDSENIFKNIKNNLCNEISSIKYHDEYTCNNLDEYDNTTQVKNNCLNGEFEKINGTFKIISIMQESNRCMNSVYVGDYNCI